MTLDFQQTAAVMSAHRNTLVLAGAGSGKTRVLVERIAHLFM
jgi:superfamily I DNA/RNA helicase